MSLGDIFRRKSLLPAGKLAKLISNNPPAKESPKSQTPAQHSSTEGVLLSLTSSSQEVFERPTVVPNLPADEHARSLMQELENREPKSSKSRSRNDEVPLSSAMLELDLSESSALGFLERQQSQAPPQRAPKPHATTTSNPDRGGAEHGGPEHETASPQGQDEPLQVQSSSQAPQQNKVSAADLYAVGDFTGALAAAELRLEEVPDDELAQSYRQRCQEVLTKMWTARLGSLDRALRVLVPPDQIRWLSVDHRAGFVLSLLDGHSTIDEVLDICGMPRLQALRILAELMNRGVIEVVR